jgi:hypothetical protein
MEIPPMSKTKINCLNCGKEIMVENKEIKRGYGKFCDRKCSANYNSKHMSQPINNSICALCGKHFYKSESTKSKSKSGLFFCCRKHKDEAQKIGGIKEIMPAHYDSSVYDYRKIAFREKLPICERCGYCTNIAAIVVHHKDKDRTNNDISNLEILCCNCHAIEHYTKRSPK